MGASQGKLKVGSRLAQETCAMLVPGYVLRCRMCRTVCQKRQNSRAHAPCVWRFWANIAACLTSRIRPKTKGGKETVFKKKQQGEAEAQQAARSPGKGFKPFLKRNWKRIAAGAVVLVVAGAFLMPRQASPCIHQCFLFAGYPPAAQHHKRVQRFGDHHGGQHL